MRAAHSGGVALLGRCLLGLAAAGLWPSPALGQVEPGSVAGEVYGAQLAASAQVERPVLKRVYVMRSLPDTVSLPPVSAPLMLAESAAGPRQIGFGRDLTSDQALSLEPARLAWSAVDRGTAAALTITSSGAAALRIALTVRRLPAGTELRFFGRDPGGPVFGPFTTEDVRSLATTAENGAPSLFWSPVIEGDTVGVEVYVPDPGQVADVQFTVPHLSHLITWPGAPERAINNVGDSGACNIDVACYSATWGTTARAVAKYVFTQGTGTFACTGTLLADRDLRTFSPYFLTASHCISTSSAAATVNTYWFFQRASCGGGAQTPSQQLTRGATLLSNDAGVDYSLLRLNEPAPAGVTFAGWTENNPSPGAAIVGLHHPQGDLKKISFGGVDGVSSLGGPATGSGSYLKVRWSLGVTEPGSSGSAIFTGGAWPNQYVLGMLSGGNSSCANPTASDWYGRFASAYPSLRRWLSYSGADLTVFRPGTDVWYSLTAASGWASDTEISWGLPGDQPIRGDFDGDGKPDPAVWRPGNGTWYILWSGSNYNPASASAYQWGLTGDLPLAGDFDRDGKTDLAVWRPSNGTWYILWSGTGFSYSNQASYQWGLSGDVPLATDFDGDGKTDLAVWRPADGTWHLRFSSSNFTLATSTWYQWGIPGDVPLAGDFDGDGRTDLVVWRPADGTWYVRFSSSGYSYGNWTYYQWGLPGDVPAQGDFDGDGKSDLAVWRPSDGVWYLRYSIGGYRYDTWQRVQWGLPGDLPLNPR